MRFSYSIFSILFMSSIAFAEGSDRLDQDYKRKEHQPNPWVLLNTSYVTDIPYSKSVDVNYFFERSIPFKYVYVKLNCEDVYVRSVQSFNKTAPINARSTAKDVYLVDGLIDRLRISLFQNKSKKSVACATELYGYQELPEVDNVFPNPSDVVVLLGRVTLGGDLGGATNQREIRTQGAFLKSVYVKLSGDACSDLLLAEVGTFSSRVYDLAEPTSADNFFAINDGDGLRVDSVRINFVGAASEPCVASVYGSVKNFVKINFP